jgi:hypothetical protein
MTIDDFRGGVEEEFSLTEMRAGFSEVPAETQGEFEEVRAEMRAGFAQARTETQGELSKLRAEIKTEGERTRRHFDIMVEKVRLRQGRR